MNKLGVLSSIVLFYHGSIVADSAEFEISGYKFTAWFTEPVFYGEGFTSPSSFSIRCQAAGMAIQLGESHIIKEIGSVKNQNDNATIKKFLDSGFDEIEIGSNWIDLRKTNFILNDDNLLKNVIQICPLMPLIIHT